MVYFMNIELKCKFPSVCQRYHLLCPTTLLPSHADSPHLQLHHLPHSFHLHQTSQLLWILHPTTTPIFRLFFSPATDSVISCSSFRQVELPITRFNGLVLIVSKTNFRSRHLLYVACFQIHILQPTTYHCYRLSSSLDTAIALSDNSVSISPATDFAPFTTVYSSSSRQSRLLLSPSPATTTSLVLAINELPFALLDAVEAPTVAKTKNIATTGPSAPPPRLWVYKAR